MPVNVLTLDVFHRIGNCISSARKFLIERGPMPPGLSRNRVRAAKAVTSALGRLLLSLTDGRLRTGNSEIWVRFAKME